MALFPMKRAATAFAVAVLTFVAVQANADDAVPAIRQFDVATIESLGQQIYKQDQEAWHATDALMAQHSQTDLVAQGLRGWIVVQKDGRDVVRFIAVTGTGSRVLYDATYAADGTSSVSQPADGTLSTDETAQYAARTLALQSVDRPCAPKYNTVALKDPESDGWLVWALAATEKPGAVVYGGHYRFTISHDGKTVLRKDALSRSCMTSEPDSTKPKPVGMMFTQLVSNIPVETTVWLNLEHGIPMYIGTPDAKIWKVENGEINPVQ